MIKTEENNNRAQILQEMLDVIEDLKLRREWLQDKKHKKDALKKLFNLFKRQKENFTEMVENAPAEVPIADKVNQDECQHISTLEALRRIKKLLSQYNGIDPESKIEAREHLDDIANANVSDEHSKLLKDIAIKLVEARSLLAETTICLAILDLFKERIKHHSLEVVIDKQRSRIN